jgi:hypothetical protein
VDRSLSGTRKKKTQQIRSLGAGTPALLVFASI